MTGIKSLFRPLMEIGVLVGLAQLAGLGTFAWAEGMPPAAPHSEAPKMDTAGARSDHSCGVLEGSLDLPANSEQPRSNLAG